MKVVGWGHGLRGLGLQDPTLALLGLALLDLALLDLALLDLDPDPDLDLDRALREASQGPSLLVQDFPDLVRIPADVSSDSGDVSTGYEAVGAKRR